jgi:CRP/FNR family cyclic AMP-dependent transcriptional regulator
MISPEALRRYPFFGTLDFNQLKEIAIISDIVTFEKGELIFEECGPADALYLVTDGLVDLFYRSIDEEGKKPPKELVAGEVSPGEFLGFSSLIEPYSLNATAIASQSTRLIKIDAPALRALCDKDPLMGYRVMTQLAKEAIARLIDVRIQLAAAWS